MFILELVCFSQLTIPELFRSSPFLSQLINVLGKCELIFLGVPLNPESALEIYCSANPKAHSGFKLHCEVDVDKIIQKIELGSPGERFLRFKDECICLMGTIYCFQNFGTPQQVTGISRASRIL